LAGEADLQAKYTIADIGGMSAIDYMNSLLSVLAYIGTMYTSVYFDIGTAACCSEHLMI
jgi:hypothetical protein